MNRPEEIVWPRSFKFSVVAGIGFIAAEATYVGLQAMGILEPTILENVAGGVVALAGGWRIAEPFIMIHEWRNPGTTIFRERNQE